jgi:hypothetical protein
MCRFDDDTVHAALRDSLITFNAVIAAARDADFLVAVGSATDGLLSLTVTAPDGTMTVIEPERRDLSENS